MLLRCDRQRIQRGLQPQARLFEPAPLSPGFGHLLGEHEQHLTAVLMPESRRIAAQQCSVNSRRAHHASLITLQ
jgi:hypothetical protein